MLLGRELCLLLTAQFMRQMLALESHRAAGAKRAFGQSFALCCRNLPEGSSNITSRNTIPASYFPCSHREKNLVGHRSPGAVALGEQN